MKTYLFATETDYKNGKLTGAHKRLLELVNEFSKENKVVMVSNEIPSLANNSNVEFKYISNKNRNHVPAHINGILNITKVLKKEKIKYDYAISFGPSNTLCYKFAGYKNVVTLLREDLIGYLEVLNASKIKKTYFQFLERISAQYSEKIIVQCENDKKTLIERNKKYCKNIENKIFVQINNVNASWMKEYNLKHTIIDDGYIRILFIGDFSNSRKGHGILLPAVKRILDEKIKIKLYIAGDGREFDYYQQSYKDYEDIIFLGRVNNMEKYLSVCDFEIVPSLIDSCPNTLLEGLNAGIAVYGSDTGGIPDLLTNRRYLFVPNEENIYHFLKNIIDEKSYIQDSINQMTRRKELTFDWADSVRMIIEKGE